MTTATLYLIHEGEVPPARAQILRRALRLEVMSVGWSVFEGTVAVAAAAAAASVVLLGFGADSFVESLSAVLMLWRLSRERRTRDVLQLEQLEGLSRRLTAGSLVLLGIYVAADAARALVTTAHPRFSPVGAGMLAVSMAFTMGLARAKRRAAAALGSRALAADAFQTTACWWLSAIALGGLAVNALWGWWWADPAAALGAAALIGREGFRTWRGEETCCCGHGAGFSQLHPDLSLLPHPVAARPVTRPPGR